MLSRIMAFNLTQKVDRMLARAKLPGSSIELVFNVLGIDDPWIWGVYLLCIFSALLCVIYGIVKWNKEGELEALEVKEEAAWEASEEEMQEKELGL